MRWASGVSEKHSPHDALAECFAMVSEGLNGEPADLVLVFVSAHFQHAYSLVPHLVRDGLSLAPGAVVVGCTGSGVIGAGREVEHRPGIALAAAVMPDVKLTPFHIEESRLPDADAGPDRWEELVGVRAKDVPHFIILADPFTIHGESLLMGLDFAFPGSVKIGGLASGATERGGHAMFLSDRAHGGGAVGVAMSGNVEIDTIVAQGCRPIGRPLQVTAGGSNVITGLDGRPPMAVLDDLLAGLPEQDRALSGHSLFIGVLMDEMKDTPRRGDFLVRNIVGIDRGTGAIGVATEVHVGQTIQFHLRDAGTSADDLHELLAGFGAGGESPNGASERLLVGAGALMFSCVGRGSYLYGRADHDTDLFRDRFGPMPLTGFFCNGEIGGVAGTTFLHGYTMSLGLVRAKSQKPEG